MKIKEAAYVLALLALGLFAPQPASAQSASGTYQFTFEDRYTKYVDFEARKLAGGGATGRMHFSDEARVTYGDPEGDREVVYEGFYINADVDDLVVNRNQAVVSGVVRESNIPDLVGQRVLLTVEDNGDNTREPDRLTWGFYKPQVRDWTPSDAELREDSGVGLRWRATDAERQDDRGYEMPRDESINANTFPLSSYNFPDIASGAGDITVRS